MVNKIKRHVEFHFSRCDYIQHLCNFSGVAMQFMVLMILPLKMTFRGVLDWATVKAVIFACLALLSSLAVAQQIDPADISRGAYLARVGDCIACHTAGPQSPPFAGGLPINSPFGIIYSTNITPDPLTGIGRYTLEDFSRAVRNGIAKDGRRLYPAMPYPSFTAITDDDIRALHAYFMNEVTPVNYKTPETKLPFPFNIRLSLFFWMRFSSNTSDINRMLIVTLSGIAVPIWCSRSVIAAPAIRLADLPSRKRPIRNRHRCI